MVLAGNTNGKENGGELPASQDRIKKTGAEGAPSTLDVSKYEAILSLMIPDIINATDAGMLRLRELAIQMGWISLLNALGMRGVTMAVLDEFGWNGLHLADFYMIDIPPILREIQDDDRPAPRPSRFYDHEGESKVEISKDGCEVRLRDSTRIVMTDNPIHADSGRYYFEIHIKSLNQEHKKWSIGVIPVYSQLEDWSVHVGWSVGLGWHGDDGRVAEFRDGSAERKDLAKLPKWGQDYGALDIVGLGFDYNSGKIFFTKNGRLVGIVGIGDTKTRYRPAVSVPKGCTARIHLDEKLFKYKDWKESVQAIEKLVKESGTMSPPPKPGRFDFRVGQHKLDFGPTQRSLVTLRDHEDIESPGHYRKKKRLFSDTSNDGYEPVSPGTSAPEAPTSPTYFSHAAFHRSPYGG
ncbi:hypothetical protein ABW19_dt0205012 [Dactylella cylindrospora]|nr:hypothetical protein ABW19_dt0205012 [Dactylella cylindrospora]